MTCQVKGFFIKVLAVHPENHIRQRDESYLGYYALGVFYAVNTIVSIMVEGIAIVELQKWSEHTGNALA
jgi:hypothetical protein